MPPRQIPVAIQQAQANILSIFYVHPSEGLNSVMITPRLIGSNYLAWNRFMKHTLGAKNKSTRIYIQET